MLKKLISSKRAIAKTLAVAITIVVIAVAAIVAYFVWPRPPDVTTLNICSIDYDFGPALQDLIPAAYEEYTDGRVKVNVDLFPYDPTHEKELIELSAHSSNYDLFVLDCPWVGEFAEPGWIYCIDDLKEQNPTLPDILWDKFFACLELYTIEDKHYGIVMSAATPMFGYRMDLFDEYDVEVPTNWEEYISAAKNLTRDTDGDGEIDLWGCGLALGGADPGYNEPLYMMYGYGPSLPNDANGVFLSDDGEIAFNETLWTTTVNRLKELFPYSPLGTLGAGWGERAALYYEGKTAMIIAYQDTWAEVEDPLVSKVVGKTGYRPLPYDVVNYHPVAGLGMAINKFSEHPEEAYKFLAWMTEGEAYRLLAESSVAPPITEVVEDPEIQAELPMLEVWEEIGHTRPIASWLPQYTELQRIMWEETSFVIVGDKTPEEAYADLVARALAAKP